MQNFTNLYINQKARRISIPKKKRHSPFQYSSNWALKLFETLPDLAEVAATSQANAIQSVQGLGIGVRFNQNIRNRDLQITSKDTDPPAHSGHFPQPEIVGEALGHFGDNPKRCGLAGSEERGSEVVEPEYAGNGSGAIVECESEEFVGFMVPGSDYTDDFDA
ncbi:hypothetical protein V6N13_042029 [Hibiscus sabdariffa]|uniref:Uncharacterized protein n=1 Tax=Hibiscus sabdariffa TaxID=183260 RepID=A0ABR2DDT2_9ROSI